VVLRYRIWPGLGARLALSIEGGAGRTPGILARVTVVLLPGNLGWLMRGLPREFIPDGRIPALGCLVAGE